MKNDEGKERRRSKSVRNEASSERTERHVKQPSCTETSTADNKVYEECHAVQRELDVSEDHTTSVFRVKARNQQKQMASCVNYLLPLVSFLLYFFTLKMNHVYSSETLGCL